MNPFFFLQHLINHNHEARITYLYHTNAGVQPVTPIPCPHTSAEDSHFGYCSICGFSTQQLHRLRHRNIELYKATLITAHQDNHTVEIFVSTNPIPPNLKLTDFYPLTNEETKQSTMICFSDSQSVATIFYKPIPKPIPKMMIVRDYKKFMTLLLDFETITLINTPFWLEDRLKQNGKLKGFYKK